MTLKIENLHAGYGDNPVITGANAMAQTGELTVLIGPNGTGKSTILKALAGLIVSRGRMELDGTELSLEARRRDVAYMPQDTGATSSLTVLEVVLLGKLRSLGLTVPWDLQAKALTILRDFGMEGFQDRTLDALSGGQRQLVFLAQALFREPNVLLLDEPTAALDLRHQLIVLNKVREYAAKSGIVAIAAMHDLTLAAQFADRIICLAHGAITASGPARFVLTEERLRSVYGVETAIAATPAGYLSITPLRPCA